MAIKSANVIARVDPNIKKQAEDIISDLGLNASSVINALYRQIIIKKGIPFEMRKEPINVDDMTEDELSEILVKRIENYRKTGEGYTVEEVFERLHEKIRKDEERLQNNNLQRSKL